MANCDRNQNIQIWVDKNVFKVNLILTFKSDWLEGIFVQVQ